MTAVEVGDLLGIPILDRLPARAQRHPAERPARADGAFLRDEMEGVLRGS
jgi:hypothetical protein